MKKIVVPVDFSTESAKALNKAVYMAKKLEASVYLVHVNKVRSFAFFSGRTTERDEDIEHGFEQLLGSVKPNGVHIDYSIRKGNVAHEVTELANELKALMIIMGTHGASGSHEFWMGSNAFRVVSHAACPVLTMRGEIGTDEIRKIVMPIDASFTSRQKVPLTAQLAKVFRAEVHVLGVCATEAEEPVMKTTTYATQAQSYLEDRNVRTVYEFLTGDNVATLTIEYAQKVGADLISIMTEQGNSLKNPFLGPYAQQLVNHSPIPVMSMRGQEGSGSWY